MTGRRIRRRARAGEAEAKNGTTTRRAYEAPSLYAWPGFVLQVLAIACVELGEDILRGNVFPPSGREAIRNAYRVIHFEKLHDFFIEPALQMTLSHTSVLMGLIAWPAIVRLVNTVYAFAHIAVALGVAVWIFTRHRSRWPLVRNAAFLTNVLALAGYEFYPMAPPRLTPGIMFDHHPFHFVDTMRYIIGVGKLNGTPIGYDPFSAMPSLHIAWSLIVAAAVVCLTDRLCVRLLAALYPSVMLFAVVVTANHYLLDAAGAAVVVGVAFLIALGLEREWMQSRLSSHRLARVIRGHAP